MNESRPTPSFSNVAPGDPAPWFEQRTANNPAFIFDTVGGRYIVLCFLGTAGDDPRAFGDFLRDGASGPFRRHARELLRHQHRPA
jgi:hypothetical protein